MIKIYVSEQSKLLKSKLDEYVEKTLGEKDEFNYCVFDLENDSVDDIIYALETPSFSSIKKIVVCKNPVFFLKEKKEKEEQTEIAEEKNKGKKIDVLEEYINKPNEDSDLIIICPSKYYVESNRYFKMILKKGSVENLLLTSNADFDNYADALISKNNIKINIDAKNELLNRCRGDVCKLEVEIEKLASYMDVITKQTILKLVARPLEDKTYELSNAILANDKAKAYGVYLDLKTQKVEPVALVGYLAKQFRTMLLISVLVNEGKSFADIGQMLDYQAYRIQKLYESVKQFGVKKIKDTIVKLSDVDVNLKSNAEDKFLVFELFLLSI